MSDSRILPSMFHRRIVLLVGLCALAFGVLALQMGRLTILRGEASLEEAERRLQRSEWTPTPRGKIIDRKKRILAQDRPSLDVQVRYDVLISGLPEEDETGRRQTWVRTEAVRMAREIHEDEWRKLDAPQREALAAYYEPFLLRHVEQMWLEIAQFTGASAEEMRTRRTDIRHRIEYMRQEVTKWRYDALEREAEERGRELTTDLRDRLRKQADGDIAEQRAAHTIVPLLGDTGGFSLAAMAAETTQLVVPPKGGGAPVAYEVPALPGLRVADSRERAHPFDSVVVEIDGRTLPGPLRTEAAIPMTVEGALTHVLGWIREGPTAEDEQRRAAYLEGLGAEERKFVTAGGADRGQYFEGDSVGDRGVEFAQEPRLRGLRGLRRRQLDTGEVFEIAPTPGEDVELTIDAMLQARIMAAMDPALGLASVAEWHNRDDLPEGTPLYGAAVVIEINTGDVMALVSTPSFSYDQLAENRAAIFADRLNMPYFNRAVSGAYPPGSIAKAILLTAAVTRGAHQLWDPITCNGHYLPDDATRLRCWRYRKDYGFGTHGALDAVEALKVSCNIYFYTIGHRLGREGIIEAYRMFGAGEALPLGVGAEAAGVVGPLKEMTWQYDDAIMGIGQGKVVWTPVHAANAYATLARGGFHMQPRVVPGASRSDPPVDLQLDPASVRAALDGLYASANMLHGTGYQISGEGWSEPTFNVEGVTVWAKTGTAQSAPRRFDPDDKDGPEPEQVLTGDHAWVVGLVGPEGEGPRYSFAVLMEYAGSGGRVSGPIANQVIHALRAEGHLKRRPNVAAGSDG
ncbi:MAG: penicillin-binding transpeptidase domain-containing protein [Phycisphaerales bacterium JB039]